MTELLLSYLGLCVLITITPGLDTAVVVRSVLRGGRSAGILTAIGCAAGLFVHAVAVAVGLAQLLLHSALAFEVVKLAGAAVLVVLGVRTLWVAWRTGKRSVEEAPQRWTNRTPVVQGLLTNLTNPKATLFFLAALPQFVPTNDPQRAVPIALALAAIAVLFSLVGLGLVTLAVSRVRELLKSRRARRVQETLLGGTLVALGVKVATE
jgi:threonine/homoserine/homoserine lactone efflux protein